MSLFDKNMSKEKRASFELAEDAREADWSYPSFVARLFQGKVEWDLIAPFPEQSPEDKKIGDDYIAKLEAFLKKHMNPDEIDRTGEIPKEVMQGLADLGAFAMKIPTKYNGLGLSQVNYNRALHLVGSYCGSTTALLSAHQSIGVPQPLLMFGTEEQKQKYLPMFRKGVVSAFALTEPHAGSDPRAMTTSAVPTEDGKHFIINGEKLWCTNGTVAGVIIVMAVTPPQIVHGKERKQITAFIVEANTPGFEVHYRCRFMGLKALYNGVLRFKNVKVPKENMLLGEGDGMKIALKTLNTGRLTIPAAVTGISKWCMALNRKWAKERVQWGNSIGEHETIAGKLAWITANTFAQEAIAKLSSHMADNKRFDIRLEAAMTKLFGTEVGYKIVDETLQIRGGRGYETSPSLKGRGEIGYPVERALRDSRVNLIFEGSSEIMHLFIAREALDFHLKFLGPLFNPRLSPVKKLQAVVGMMFHYALWYPQLWIPAWLGRHYNVIRPLNKHMMYVKSTSKKMSIALFHRMAIYQKKFAEKQHLMNRFVDIGMDLFVMAACCAYADMLVKKGKKNAVELADYFCKEARVRIARNFKAIRCNYDSTTNRLSKHLLEGTFTWMEDGIIPPEEEKK